jgi:hypothetical protein
MNISTIQVHEHYKTHQKNGKHRRNTKNIEENNTKEENKMILRVMLDTVLRTNGLKDRSTYHTYHKSDSSSSIDS